MSVYRTIGPLVFISIFINLFVFGLMFCGLMSLLTMLDSASCVHNQQRFGRTKEACSVVDGNGRLETSGSMV